MSDVTLITCAKRIIWRAGRGDVYEEKDKDEAISELKSM
jgi:hypothetical protein